MSQINPIGIDLVTGQQRPLNLSDAPTDTAGSVLLAYTGIQGQTGTQGTTGVEGSRGFTGIQPTGLRGITGVIGLTGIQNDITGLGGITGLRGATGLRGRTGVAGATGAQGITGAQGFPGNFALLFSSTTITFDAYIIGITGGGFTVTLPAANSAGFRKFLVQDESGNATSNNTTIARSGSDNIVTLGGPVTTMLLSENYEQIQLQSDGSANYYARRIKRGLTGIQGATGVTGATGIQGETGVAGATGI